MSKAPSLGLLHLAVFCSSFDRLVIAPLLLAIADDLGISLADAGIIASVYLVGYGVMQIVWGMVSDRLGRVRTMRLALLLAAVAGIATAAAPDVATLLLARFVAGGAFAAIVPGALIYVGDTVPVAQRHGPLTDVMMMTATGMAAATLVGALLADLASWRLAFGVPAAVVLLVVVLMSRLPEVAAQGERLSVRAALTRVLGNRWALVVFALAFVEGVVLLSVLNFLPTVLQNQGMSTTFSGAVTAAYGVAVILATRVVKAVADRMTQAQLVAVGGASGAGAFVGLVIDPGTAGVLIACVLLAGAWAFMHSTLQKWATEVAPDARATSVSLFASSLFIGSAAGTALGAVFADRGDFVTLFAIGLGIAAVLGVAATVLRARSE
ncbi:MFS transporter [Georgenia sp. Z1491]|uniref:MFS transporter n=1 Tax=Georgenia sp. Z1491 TaxID=3416707 RepID=UPI003CF07F2D